jgi:hypothetical protein
MTKPFLPLFATFTDLVSAVKDGRAKEGHRAGRFARGARLPWVRSRGTWLCTSNKNGPCRPRERGDCPDWDGTKREIVALIAKVEAYYPEVEHITIEGGYDAAERLDDFDNGGYEPWVGEWEVLLWSRPQPVSAAVVEKSTRVEAKEDAHGRVREHTVTTWDVVRSGELLSAWDTKREALASLEVAQ